MAEELAGGLAMLEGEKKPAQLGSLLLTNKRLVCTGRTRGESGVTTGMIENVDSAVAEKAR